MTGLNVHVVRRKQTIAIWSTVIAVLFNVVLLPVPGVGAGTYTPLKAVQYANKWWNKRNPKFQSYGSSDCANYVSQCLIAGGLNLRVSPSADKSGSIATCTGLDAYLTLRSRLLSGKLPPVRVHLQPDNRAMSLSLATGLACVTLHSSPPCNRMASPSSMLTPMIG